MNSISSFFSTVAQSSFVAKLASLRQTAAGEAILSRTTAVALLGIAAYALNLKGVSFQMPLTKVRVDAVAADEVNNVPAQQESSKTVGQRPWVSASVTKTSVAATIGALFAGCAATFVLFKKF